MKNNYKKTIYACFTAFVVQAIVNNFAPLLFLTFHDSFGIPLSKITFLVTMNFAIQLLVDLISVKFVDKLGYRFCMVVAHIFSAIGLLGLGIFPFIFLNSYFGIIVAVSLYAIGGGLLEVLVSPVMEACPTENKQGAMSLLHSFYCWGHVGLVLLSTLFFICFGIEKWPLLACIWALVPIYNSFVFSIVPIGSLIPEGESSMSLKELLQEPLFWFLLFAMICAGACEQAVSQWASTFAEMGLGVSKTIGDLTGPMLFAILMGISRAVFGNYGAKLPLQKCLCFTSVLCLCSYLVISLAPYPVISLIACGITGFSVGIMWPGTFSTASVNLPKGGTALFALLALGGDVGCSVGPTVTGLFANLFNENLKMGILCASFFPVAMLFFIFLISKAKKHYF